MTLSSTTTIVAAIVLTAVCLFFANMAVVTHSSVGLMKSMAALQAGLDEANSDSLRSDLVGLQEKLAALHGTQENLNGGMETLDHLVEAINQQNHTPSASKPDIVSAYSKDEMENIATLLTELKTGFTQYRESATKQEHVLLDAVNGVSSRVDSWHGGAALSSQSGGASEMGSMFSQESMQHHANVAVIRRDLPMLLPTVRLLIGILSGPSNIDRRNEVRQTWVTQYRRSLGVARQWSVWFLVSSPKNDEEAAQVRAESDEYGDIMLMSYLAEDYHLIGAKVVEFFHAASLFPQLQFVMKGDDDTFVRVDRLLAQLDNHRNGNLFMGCNMRGSPAIRAENNKRYYVAPSEYSPKTFPPYCSGGGYVLSMDVVRAFDYVGQAAGYEPFKFEDVNTGMLIDIAGLQIQPTQGKGFYCWGPPKKTDGKNIEDLHKDWVVYHYVGLKKKWNMQTLLKAVQSEEPAKIFQKMIRIETHNSLSQWGVKEVEFYRDAECSKHASLAKAFGVGTLAVTVKDKLLATTWGQTTFDASSNADDAHLAFDGELETEWVSSNKNEKHSLTLKYGVHSVPFSELGCLKVVESDSMSAGALDISFWDDDDAQWHMEFENVQGTSGIFKLK